MTNRPLYLPTPEEIRDACHEIISKMTLEERCRRRTGDRDPQPQRVYKVAETY